MKKRAIFIFAIFLIIIFAVFFYLGLQLDKDKNKDTNLTDDTNSVKSSEINEKIENENTVEAVSSEEKTGPNTILTLQKYYIECGHTITTNTSLPEELVNLTEEEIEEEYNDWELLEFSNEEIILLKELDSFCGQHYLLTESDGFIVISTIDEHGIVNFKEKTDLSVDYLPETDRITLKNGLMVYGTDELNKLLEDFE